MSSEKLVFDDLSQYLLLKNGNFLYKIPFRDGHAVLKVYYGSRSNWVRFTKSFNNYVLLGQTTYWPRTRLKVEVECLELWRKHGFRVFDFYPEVEVEAPHHQCPPGGYLVTGYVEAPVLEEILVDESIPMDDRMATYRRFLEVWCRRHDVAEKERDARLMHENGDFGHVFVLDDGGDEFLWFDLEMVYRDGSRVEEYLWHEIIQYLWYILKKSHPTVGDRVLAETIEHYPNRERLAEAHRVFIDHPRFYMRWGRKLDSMRKNKKKPHSKYNVARRLRDAMRKAGVA